MKTIEDNFLDDLKEEDIERVNKDYYTLNLIKDARTGCLVAQGILESKRHGGGGTVSVVCRCPKCLILA